MTRRLAYLFVAFASAGTPHAFGQQADEDINALVSKLTELKEPDFGLSTTMAGTRFAPVPNSGRFGGGFLLTDHGLKEAGPLKRVVEQGPAALPVLLGALKDARPTGIVIEHRGGFGAMWYGHEIVENPNNPDEVRALKEVIESRKKNPFGNEGAMVNRHVVSVGDVCFVALGQIANRPYMAVRYQPSACIVINSPVHDAKLAEEIRTIWGKDKHREKLLDSLKLDFGSPAGEGGHFQDGAAMRLLYYFPEEGIPLIVKRLQGPDVSEELIRAVGWTKDRRIRTELVEIYKKTADTPILLAALPALGDGDEELAVGRLKASLDALPQEEGGPFGSGFRLLSVIVERYPRHAPALLATYLQNPGVQRIRSACQVFARSNGKAGDLAVDVLTPFLTDTRPAEGWNYAVERGKNEPRLPIRLCDEAAEGIRRNNPELHFELIGTHEHLDRQIEFLRKTIAERKK